MRNGRENAVRDTWAQEREYHAESLRSQPGRTQGRNDEQTRQNVAIILLNSGNFAILHHKENVHGIT